MSQIQVRIDLKTKNQVKKILEELGLDISAAVKMMFKQIAHLGALPYEVRDVNGFTPKAAQELREARIEARNNKVFNTVDEFIEDLES